MQKLGPKHRMCRRVGAAVCGRPNCPRAKRPFPPGQHGRARRRMTEYHLRLLEKQKLRAIYGVGERQFRRYFHEATRTRAVTAQAPSQRASQACTSRFHRIELRGLSTQWFSSGK